MLNIQFPAGFTSCPLCYILGYKVDSSTVFPYQDMNMLRSMNHYPTMLQKMRDEGLSEYLGIYGRPFLECKFQFRSLFVTEK